MENRKLKPPKQIHRTTIYELVNNDPLISGVYNIAYLGKIMYVGRTESTITDRLAHHCYEKSKLGRWLTSIQDDWVNVRIDILEPASTNDKKWLAQAEEACIKKFRPLFNDLLKPDIKVEIKLDEANLCFC